MHWVFAVKYWSLSYKLELIRNQEDADKNRKLFTTIYVIGIFLNVAAGIFIAFSVGWILFFLGITIIFITCFVLFDAYRRFAKVSQTDQVIEKFTVVMNSLAFGLFALSFLMQGVVSVRNEKNGDSFSIKSLIKVYKYFEATIVFYFLSCFIMALILYSLVRK